MLSRLAALVTALLISSFIATLAPTHAATPTTQRVFLPMIVATPALASQDAPATAEVQALTLINAQRAAHGCPPVQLHPALTAAAAAHSRDMAVQNYFSHRGKDGSSFSHRAQASGYPYFASSEIIAAGYDTAAGAVTGWMNSTGHRAAILTCANDDVGIGLYADPNSQWRYYWTAVFGQR